MTDTLAKLMSPSKSKKRRNPPSKCTKNPYKKYKKCTKSTNKNCRWVYGSVNNVKTGVKQHCRTRRNQSRVTSLI
jgi:hypothetical protein